jgi:hypothetical protein
MNARERQLQHHRLVRALHEQRTVTDRIRADLAQGLVTPSDVLALPALAARVVAAAEPLWAGVVPDVRRVGVTQLHVGAARAPGRCVLNDGVNVGPEQP